MPLTKSRRVGERGGGVHWEGGSQLVRREGKKGGRGGAYKAVELSIWLVTCAFLIITINHFMCLQDLVNRGSEQLMLLKQ